MKKGNAAVASAERAVKPRALWHDAWFWLALLLGAVVCEGLALLLGRTQPAGIDLEAWRQLLWLVVIYPVVEEWVFRGQMQPRVMAIPLGALSCCGISMANTSTTLLFAAFHLFSHTAAWAALVIVPSLVFGAFRDRYNSILPGTLLHSGYNLIFFTIFGLPA